MTLCKFINELKSAYRIPFIPDMEPDGDIEFPGDSVMPVTEDVYWYFLELLPPRWMSGSAFVYAAGANQFRLFWQEGSDYFGREMTADETERFCELARVPLHQ